MRHQLQRFYIESPDRRILVDVRGFVPVGVDLTGQLQSVARRSACTDDLRRGLRALAERYGLVADVTSQPDWDGTGLGLRVAVASAT